MNKKSEKKKTKEEERQNKESTCLILFVHRGQEQVSTGAECLSLIVHLCSVASSQSPRIRLMVQTNVHHAP